MATDTKTITYEAMFLFPAGASAELEKSITMARGIIERHDGKIIVIKKWDERKLTYEIRGNKRGLYIVAFFTAPGGAVVGIERDVNLSEDILRVLVTHADHLNETEMAAVEPQPIIPREERQPWDRPFSFNEDGPLPRRPMRPRSSDDKPEAPAPMARD
jgi:small subunit ribosomal protein S6